MRIPKTFMRAAAAAALLASAGACATGSGIGSILGNVLGGGMGQGNQVSGYVQGVDMRNRQIGIQQSNGQTLVVAYDNNTQVLYNNQNYSVASLQNGDQITARIQQLQNGGYYTDVVQVDRSINGPSTIQSGNVQLFQGTVRQVDSNNGLFLLDVNNGARVTVQLGQQISRSDFNRFRSLRPGDYTRLYGVYLNNSRVELREFN